MRFFGETKEKPAPRDGIGVIYVMGARVGGILSAATKHKTSKCHHSNNKRSGGGRGVSPGRATTSDKTTPNKNSRLFPGRGGGGLPPGRATTFNNIIPNKTQVSFK